MLSFRYENTKFVRVSDVEKMEWDLVTLILATKQWMWALLTPLAISFRLLGLFREVALNVSTNAELYCCLVPRNFSYQ